MTLINLRSQRSGNANTGHHLAVPCNLIRIPGKNPLELFSSISLDELGKDSLLDRQEIKYLLSEDRLGTLLSGLEAEYRVLEIQGRHSFDYRSVYFDTPDRLFYVQHHAGTLPRWKIRQRTYLNSGLTYLEVKYKDNRRVTHKNRMQINTPAGLIAEESNQFLETHYPGRVDDLTLFLETRYSRITLVRKAGVERITIDRGLQFSHGTYSKSIPGLVIAEIKQARLGPRSPFTHQLKQIGVRPGGFSKYCIGSTLLNPTLKQNRFKPNLLQIASLGDRGKHNEWS
jgi:hypothetical protein